MGIFLNKIIKPLFRSKKGNWVSRINELIDNQLKITVDASSLSNKESDLFVFSTALDGVVDIIENYDTLLEGLTVSYVKFDIKTAKPIHILALKNPEKLSEEDKLRFFDESFLIAMQMKRGLTPIRLAKSASLGILMGALGMVCFPETRSKGYQLWTYLEECFPQCMRFNYKKHLPKELVELLETAVFKK
jgi:hypothetical protein